MNNRLASSELNSYQSEKRLAEQMHQYTSQNRQQVIIEEEGQYSQRSSSDEERKEPQIITSHATENHSVDNNRVARIPNIAHGDTGHDYRQQEGEGHTQNNQRGRQVQQRKQQKPNKFIQQQKMINTNYNPLNRNTALPNALNGIAIGQQP